MSRIAAALAAPPVYAPEALRDRAHPSRSGGDAAFNPVVLTRLFLLLASAVIMIVLAARGGWLLLPVVLLPLGVLTWLASHYAASRAASWVVLGLAVLTMGPVVLALLATLS